MQLQGGTGSCLFHGYEGKENTTFVSCLASTHLNRWRESLPGVSSNDLRNVFTINRFRTVESWIYVLESGGKSQTIVTEEAAVSKENSATRKVWPSSLIFPSEGHCSEDKMF